MEEEFEINEETIDSALRWLKINDPENATREKAEVMLRDLQAGLHGMAHHDPEKLLNLKKELDERKRA